MTAKPKDPAFFNKSTNQHRTFNHRFTQITHRFTQRGQFHADPAEYRRRKLLSSVFRLPTSDFLYLYLCLYLDFTRYKRYGRYDVTNEPNDHSDGSE